MATPRDTASMQALASALERACRLASALEGMLKEQACRPAEVGQAEYIPWVLAAELLNVLDEGRASMMHLEWSTERNSLPPPATQA